MTILQGVKHSDDFIFREKYEKYEKLPNTQILLAADISKPGWPGYTGLITELIDKITIDNNNTICMMCGPEAMMQAAVNRLDKLNLPEDAIYLNLERNMECATGQCGHCQFGGEFICKDGPVFRYDQIEALLKVQGL